MLTCPVAIHMGGANNKLTTILTCPIKLQHESMSSERKPQTTIHKSVAAVGVEVACVACSRRSNLLASCIQFQNMTREERWDIVKKDG